MQCLRNACAKKTTWEYQSPCSSRASGLWWASGGLVRTLSLTTPGSQYVVACDDCELIKINLSSLFSLIVFDIFIMIKVFSAPGLQVFVRGHLLNVELHRERSANEELKSFIGENYIYNLFLEGSIVLITNNKRRLMSVKITCKTGEVPHNQSPQPSQLIDYIISW